uniref:Uncharacterized protein n=1 Tax=Zeugodacus cucurbitae TaxID=28588 RepID=A0A0A1X424_ZEUCU
MLIELNLQNLTQIFWTIIFVLNLYVVLLLYRMSRIYRSERRIKLLEAANIREHIEFMRSRPEKSTSSSFSATGNFTTRSRFFEQFLDSDPSQLRSCMHIRSNFRSNSSTTAVDEEPEPKQHAQRFRTQKQQQNQCTKQLQMELQQKYQKAQKQRQQQEQLLAQQKPNPTRYRESSVMRQQPLPLRESKAFDEPIITIDNSKTDDEHTLYISDSFGRVVHEIPFRECDYMDALQVVLGDQRWKIKKAWNERAN